VVGRGNQQSSAEAERMLGKRGPWGKHGHQGCRVGAKGEAVEGQWQGRKGGKDGDTRRGMEADWEMQAADLLLAANFCYDGGT